MRYLKFEDFCVESVSLEENDGMLFVVDVQIEFKKFIPKNFVSNLKGYCKTFNSVYQVWDSNKTDSPSYKFPNQILDIEKQFGVKKYYKDLDGGIEEWFNTIFDDKVSNSIIKLLKDKNITEGDKFKLKDKNEYLVYIDNDHSWFYVNSDMYQTFKKLKGKSVVIVGGADNECLEDVYISCKSFGLKPIYNHEYIYSAETSNKETSHKLQK